MAPPSGGRPSAHAGPDRTRRDGVGRGEGGRRTTVLATFTTRDEAGPAAEPLAGRPGLDVSVGRKDDVLDALAVNQRAEVDDAAMTVAVGLWSGPMMRGAVVWGGVGLLVGAVLALPFLLVLDWPEGQRWLFGLGIMAAGALGVSSAAFLIGAVRRAQQEGEFTPEDPWAVVGVRVAAGAEGPVIEALTEAGARSVRHLTAPVARREQQRCGDPVGLPRPWPGRPVAGFAVGCAHRVMPPSRRADAATQGHGGDR